MDAAARVFSERTRGIFAPRSSASASAPPDVVLSRRILAQKLRKQEGIVQLAHSLYRIFLVPVRHASEAELRTALPLDTCVEAHWVLLPALTAALAPDQSQARRNTSDLTMYARSAS